MPRRNAERDRERLQACLGEPLVVLAALRFGRVVYDPYILKLGCLLSRWLLRVVSYRPLTLTDLGALWR